MDEVLVADEIRATFGVVQTAEWAWLPESHSTSGHPNPLYPGAICRRIRLKDIPLSQLRLHVMTIVAAAYLKLKQG